MVLRGEPAVEHDVAIEQRAYRIHQRILLVVAFHQQTVKRGDAAVAKMSGALDQLGKQREYRRRVAFRRGRLAGGQSNFALRHGERA